MKQAIQEKLTHIARTEPLHFLLAVESGSRAWGFASPDSDYDVRAIYIRPQEYYLQIDEAKDTFEFIENQWFDWDATPAKASATTAPAPTTSCPPAAPPASPRRWALTTSKNAPA